MSISINKLTVEVLRNFLSINKSIHIQSGSVISTLSVNKNIMARYECDEVFTRNLPIYDLSDFTSAIKLCQSPELDLTNDEYLLIRDSVTKGKAKIFYSDPDLIVSAHDKEIKLSDPEVSFTLPWSNLQLLIQASASQSIEDLCLYGNDGVMSICVTDKKNDTSNVYSIELGPTDTEFCHCFKMENLKLFGHRDYEVSIYGGRVALFETDKLKYWIALEPPTSK
jgi:hypothetical protein